MRRRAFASPALFACLLGLGSAATPASAATAECIPAASFSTLARITDGSMSQLAELLGLPGQAPPDEGCYAVLLSGPIDKGSAATLAAAIERNKGWLAQVYIAVWDGDLDEEAALARLMRDFALTGVLLESGDIYAPDLLVPPRPLPASVSNAWPEAELSPRQPLALSFKDYLDNTDRKIAPAAQPCGAGCWSILAGAVERRIRLPVGPKALEPPGTVEDPQAMHKRDALRTDLGAGFGLIRAAVGYRPMPRVPRFAPIDRKPIEKDCRSALDYANAIQGELAKASNAFAAKGFPFMRLGTLLPKVRRYQDAAGKADLCMRKGLARLRMKSFQDLCRDTCTATARKADETAGDAIRKAAKPAAAAGDTDAPSVQGQAPAQNPAPAQEQSSTQDSSPEPKPSPFIRRMQPQRGR